MVFKNLFYKNLNIIYKKVILDTFKCRKFLFRMVIHKHFLTLCNIRFFSSYQLVIIRWFWEQNGLVINISPFFLYFETYRFDNTNSRYDNYILPSIERILIWQVWRDMGTIVRLHSFFHILNIYMFYSKAQNIKVSENFKFGRMLLSLL